MKKQIVLLVSGILILTGCGGAGKSDPTPPPQKATLVSPALNELCNQGIQTAAGESRVTFKWNTAVNADSYELTITNLLSNAVMSQLTSGTELVITLAENTPYSWSVISKSVKTPETAAADTWKFYNSGPGTVNYAPFPANLVSPALNESVNSLNGGTTLSWDGSDVDHDALTYDLYFGTSSKPTLLEKGITASKYDVIISSGTTYFWKVVTIDVHGNSSESSISKFEVN
ncbi:MAG TPA: hypothetical protein VGM41_09980 [Chitinophagaceae bacterium]